MKTALGLALVLAGCATAAPKDPVAAAPGETAVVRKTADFEVTGDGSNPAWNRTEWHALARRSGGDLPYEARFKILYSTTGIYLLMDGTDSKLTTTHRKDFEHLWEEDVYEAFLQPDPASPFYLEYEISPMNSELPIVVPNHRGAFMGWLPWHYEGERRVRKATAVAGGQKEPGAAVRGWSAEFRIPFALLRGMSELPPPPGTRWRGNFYRVDYDGGKPTQWNWAPVGPSFHEYWNFGVLDFE